jgi:hypothetical protein
MSIVDKFELTLAKNQNGYIRGRNTCTSFTWHCLVRKQKAHPNFSIVVIEVNKLNTHLSAHPTAHVNEVMDPLNLSTYLSISILSSFITVILG